MTTRVLRTMIKRALRRAGRAGKEAAGGAAVGAAVGGALSATGEGENFQEGVTAGAITGAIGMKYAKRLGRSVERGLKNRGDRLTDKTMFPMGWDERDALAKEMLRKAEREAREKPVRPFSSDTTSNPSRALRLENAAARLRGERTTTKDLIDRRSEIDDDLQMAMRERPKDYMDGQYLAQYRNRRRSERGAHDYEINRRRALSDAAAKARTGYAEAQSAVRRRGRKSED